LGKARVKTASPRQRATASRPEQGFDSGYATATNTQSVGRLQIGQMALILCARWRTKLFLEEWNGESVCDCQGAGRRKDSRHKSFFATGLDNCRPSRPSGVGR